MNRWVYQKKECLVYKIGVFLSDIVKIMSVYNTEKELLTEEKEYWEKLFGNKLYEEIVSSQIVSDKYSVQPETQENAKLEKFFVEVNELILPDTYEFLDKEIFGPFFYLYVETMIRYGMIKSNVFFQMSEQPAENLSEIFINTTRNIPLRALLHDMYEQKKQGNLRGKNSSEEYEFYNHSFLGDLNYVRALSRLYPEMHRLLLKQAEQIGQFVNRIADALIEDKSVIVRDICSGKDYKKIKWIKTGLSDSHNGGNMVAKVFLDNGQLIIFKPRGLKKDIYYNKLFGWFCAECGMENKSIKCLDYINHGWEENLENKPCKSEKQINTYYMKMGIHLFLCMLMSASDMHGENIIADGENPILLDLECLPGLRNIEKSDNAEKEVKRILSNSIIYTGILPLVIWISGNKGQGINLSALGTGKKQILPFKVPVLINKKTSEMRIVNRKIEIKASSSLPCLEGKYANPEEYADKIIEGFSNAYILFINKKVELSKRLELFFSFESRYLIRHTQQYSMYLSASFYSDFMQNSIKRSLMLQVLRNNMDTHPTYKEDILASEISSLMNMDIPYYTFKGNLRNLYDGYGNVYKDYFRNTALDCFEERVCEMGTEDLERQKTFIRLSLALLSPEQEKMMNSYFIPDRVVRDDEVEERTLKVICKIADWICNTSVRGSFIKDVSWIGLHFFNEQSWKIEPVNMYLYDGIAGIAVFMSVVIRVRQIKRYKEMFKCLTNKLFSYTDAVTSGRKDIQMHCTGALVGEGSIVLSYILLYQITQKKEFLIYAEKHCEILERLIWSDTEYDLLSGNAGTIIVLVKLYQITEREKWMLLSKKIGEDLWGKAVKTDKICGWIPQRLKTPLAGMAHGNSGFIMAYAYLLEQTKDRRYVKRIQALLRYEDFLFSEKLGNWKDLRDESRSAIGDICANAWCHGAPGILLSRIKLFEQEEFHEDMLIIRDIKRSAHSLFQNSYRRGACLCHGMAGNYRVMKKYADAFGMTETEKKVQKMVFLQLLDTMETDTLPQEQYNPGLMTGVSGIGALLCATLLKNKF